MKDFHYLFTLVVCILFFGCGSSGTELAETEIAETDEEPTIETTPIQGEILWSADTDKEVRTVFRRLDPDGNKNPTGTRCVDDPNNPPKVSILTDATFGNYWRIHKPISRKRAEFARTNGLIPEEGKKYYIAWRWRINSSSAIANDVTVFQWKTDEGGDINNNKQNYPLNFEYSNNQLTLNAFGPAEPNWNRPGSIAKRKTTLWTGNVALNNWVTFVVGLTIDKDFNASNDRFDGTIELWFNGEKQDFSNSNFQDYQVVLSADNTIAYHKTNDGVEVYPKWGAYNENACNIEIDTDFNTMRVGTTYESVTF